MKIHNPEMSQRILSLMSDVALSNNGWAITTDKAAADALVSLGYTVSERPLGFVGSYGVYSPAGQRAATAEYLSSYVAPKRTVTGPDAESALLARAEGMTMDY